MATFINSITNAHLTQMQKITANILSTYLTALRGTICMSVANANLALHTQ